MIMIEYVRRGVVNNMDNKNAGSGRSRVNECRLVGETWSRYGRGHQRPFQRALMNIEVVFVCGARPRQSNPNALACPSCRSTRDRQSENFTVNAIDAGSFGVHPAAGGCRRAIPSSRRTTWVRANRAACRILRPRADERYGA